MCRKKCSKTCQSGITVPCLPSTSLLESGSSEVLCFFSALWCKAPPHHDKSYCSSGHQVLSEAVSGSSTQWHFPWKFPKLKLCCNFLAKHYLLMHWTLEDKSRLFLQAAHWLWSSSGKLPWWSVWKSVSVPSVIGAEREFLSRACCYRVQQQMLCWFRHPGLDLFNRAQLFSVSLEPEELQWYHTSFLPCWSKAEKLNWSKCITSPMT